MKPTVINNTSENPHQPQHDQQPNMNNANNCQAQNDHSRRFPQFRQHGFGGFDDPDGDVFADMGLRSRLNRMGNPFDWSARKRRGSGQNAGDAYDHHYFDDVDFPFGSTWDAFGRMGNKRHPAETADRSGFFDYVPQEFRQYVPEHFGTHFRGGHGHPHQQQQPQQQAPPPQQQQQAPPQQQQTYQQTGSKSNLCDAAIQTDDLGTQNNGDRRDGPNSANHHDNRNDSNVNRNSSSASSSSSSTPYGNQVHMSTSADGPGAHASASAGNNQNQYYQQSPNYAHQAPPYGRQYQQPYAPQYQYSQSPQQNQYYGQPTPPPPPPQPHPSQEGFVRNVPIVLEETGTPVNKVRAETSAAPATPPTSQTSSNKARPEPLNKESFASNEPIPMPCPPQPGSQNQQQPQQHSDNQDDADSAPPQTPHTADCISKIQAIQRDVLELMLAVEQFGGKRGDKDYAYLDEMLTRNLLKLDTIDTNGKESIRLARKEAIKCIQTSIAVLEAKSDLHLNEKRDSIDQLNKETAESGTNSEPAAVPSDEKPAEKMDVEETNAEQSSASTEQNFDANADIPKVENITIDDKPTNGNEKPPQNEAENKPEKSSATPENADAKK